MLRPLSDAAPAEQAPQPAGRRWWTAPARPLVEFGRFCRRERTWVVAMTVLVLVWTIELFIVQSVTLVYPNANGPRFIFWAPKIRLVLDLLFILTVVIWFRRRLLVGFIVASSLVYLVLVTYEGYFFRPLSLLTVMSNWREGLQLSGFALDLFPKFACAALAATMAVKLGAIYMSRRAALPRSSAWMIGVLLAATCITLEGATDLVDPLYKIQSKRGIGRLGAIRGYLLPWLAEWYFVGDQQVLQDAIERRRAPYNRLTPVEADIPIHDKLVILQAESFDYNVLGYKVDGVPVTPFLNSLRSQAMFYRVRAVHNLGSADADFVAVAGVAGSVHQTTYLIPGYPYQNTTPQMLARCGYATYSFHGNTGEFYGRRPAFEKAGFSAIYFREELEGRYGLPANWWGVADEDVLRFSAQKLRESKEPTCHIVITLTTHTPYNLLPPSQWEIYKHPRNSFEHYINNMRYLDNCLRDYFVALGKGTTVLLYGDHSTEVSGADFTPSRDGAREYIPCFIYDTDQDLAKLQKTRGKPIATNGDLNLVDMVKYLRGQVARTHNPQAEPADESPGSGVDPDDESAPPRVSAHAELPDFRQRSETKRRAGSLVAKSGSAVKLPREPKRFVAPPAGGD